MQDAVLELLGSIATQMMSSSTHIEVRGRSVPVKRTSAQHLKTATFTIDGREYSAIEQNPEKPSQWGHLARAEHQVVQFKDDESNRFVAVAVDGKVKEYGEYGRRKSA
jgi:hypothetical protein